MTGIEDAALLAVVAIGSALGASALPRASWPRRCPAAAILLWQALGLASGLAAVGTLLGLALPASHGGLVLSVLRAAGLLRDGELFGLARLFGLSEADGAPLVLVAVRLACLAAGRSCSPRWLGADRRLDRGAARQAAAAGAAPARPRRPEDPRRARRGLQARPRAPAGLRSGPGSWSASAPWTARPRRAGRRARARADPPAGAPRPGTAAVHRAAHAFPKSATCTRRTCRWRVAGRDAGRRPRCAAARRASWCPPWCGSARPGHARRRGRAGRGRGAGGRQGHPATSARSAAARRRGHGRMPGRRPAGGRAGHAAAGQSFRFPRSFTGAVGAELGRSCSWKLRVLGRTSVR